MLFGKGNQEKSPPRVSEENIQNEIRNRILKESRKREGRDDSKEATQATLDAMEDMVSLSREEMERIAEQVRAEFKEQDYQTDSPAKSYRMSPWLVIGLFIVTFLLVRRGSSWYLFSGLILLFIFLNHFLRKSSEKDDDTHHRS